MIFVTIGTQKQDFTRIFKIIENSKYLKDKEIVAQIGHTKYSNKNIKTIDFIEDDKLKKYITKSEFVICHGGIGSIFTSLKAGKKVLVVPRLKKYKEHKNDHQLEICNRLVDEKYISYLKEDEDIDEKIKELLTNEFKEYKNNKEFIHTLRENI